MNKRRFVLLDRDGTIIAEKNYLSDHNKVELLGNAALGLRKLKKLGFGLLVITNQAGIGRGYFSLDDLNLIHQKMVDLLAKEGVVIDGIYFCPHTPEDNCSCRKPKLGLIENATSQYNFAPKLSFVIGDKAVDIEMGKAAGATTLLVRTGYGANLDNKKVKADYLVDDLLEAANVIERLLS